MENLGYFLSEAPVFFLVIWLSTRLVQLRRSRARRPLYSESDQQLLFHYFHDHRKSAAFYVRLACAVLVAGVIGAFEFLVLAPFGAAILATALILSTAMVLYLMVPTESGQRAANQLPAAELQRS